MRQPQGPSFDCKLRTLTPLEEQICRSPSLAHLDLLLNDAYADDAFDSSHALDVVAAQAAWLRSRNRCVSNDCLLSSYESRLATLRKEHAIALARIGRGPYAHVTPFAGSKALSATLAQIANRSCFGIDGVLDAGDGARSILAHTCGAGCTPTDHFLIFHPQGGQYHLVLRAASCYVSGLFEGFQDERSHGLKRVMTFSRGGAADHYEDFYDYDGTVYRHVAQIEQLGIDGGHSLLLVTRDATSGLPQSD